MTLVKNFLRREPVLVISLLAAVISCIFVPPDASYLNYIDFRTLALLYALMAVVAGLRQAGVFSALARTLCGRAKSTRAIGVVLVCLSFFSSMLITNDVALLTFVPFAAVVLSLTGNMEALGTVVVLQTVAANLGSMLTPVGNPQNLFLYSYYNFSFGDFLKITFPVWAVSLFLLLLACMGLKKSPLNALPEEKSQFDAKAFALHMILFAVCLLTVLRVLPWPVMLGIVVLVLLIFDRDTLKKPDFMLLLTFAAFFVFSGNLARIPAVDSLLRNLLTGREYLTSLLTSQVISNVPAALLLSGFTENGKALLLGVNIGGLGTPIASLASLISLKLYAQTGNAKTGKYLMEFILVNLALLVILSLFRVLL